MKGKIDIYLPFGKKGWYPFYIHIHLSTLQYVKWICFPVCFGHMTNRLVHESADTLGARALLKSLKNLTAMLRSVNCSSHIARESTPSKSHQGKNWTPILPLNESMSVNNWGRLFQPLPMIFDNLKYNTLGYWVDCLIDQASDGPTIILIDWKQNSGFLAGT